MPRSTSMLLMVHNYINTPQLVEDLWRTVPSNLLELSSIQKQIKLLTHINIDAVER